ncbi:MAG: hypothetical protein MJ082_05210 [Clostridia bacterium]|nr:hypothetical protein [Clostridia bacterium]
MNTTKIQESAIADLKVASLPSRPTAPTSYGGKGYTSAQMKEAFDKLPLYIIEKFNGLIDDLSDTEAGSFAASLLTGIREGHTLKDLFEDIADGSIAAMLPVGDTTLQEKLTSLTNSASEAENFITGFRAEVTLDGGSPADREEVC